MAQEIEKGSLIWYNASNATNTDTWVQSLNKFLDRKSSFLTDITLNSHKHLYARPKAVHFIGHLLHFYVSFYEEENISCIAILQYILCLQVSMQQLKIDEWWLGNLDVQLTQERI